MILLVKPLYHLSSHHTLSNPLGKSISFKMKVKISKIVLGMLEQLFTTEFLHCIEYDGEEEVCYFDLTIDFLNGDIIFIHKI